MAHQFPVVQIPEIGKRIKAFLVDAGITFVSFLPVSVWNVGWLSPQAFVMYLGILYFLFRDGSKTGQSIGKKALNIRVVHLATLVPCSRIRSLVRQLLLLLPPFGGLLLLVELLIIVTRQDGRRIGDFLTGTIVIDSEPTDLENHE